jgi:hypothetical protein
MIILANNCYREVLDRVVKIPFGVITVIDEKNQFKPNPDELLAQMKFGKVLLP